MPDRSITLTALALAAVVVTLSPASARHRHAARHNDLQSPTASRQPMAPEQPSAGSTYRNHIVEDGMTQDQLDRTPGR